MPLLYRDAMAELVLTTTLAKRGPAAAIVLTDEQVAELGEGARTFPVVLGLADQEVPLRLARMGGENLVGLNRAVRAQLGVEAGDAVTVRLRRDEAPREVPVPDDLAAALDAAGARAAFDALAPSHRKEWVRWVTEAKRAETRATRVAATAEDVAAGRSRR